MSTYVGRRPISSRLRRRKRRQPSDDGPERLRRSPILWFTVTALAVLGLVGLLTWHLTREPPAPMLAVPAAVVDDGGGRSGLLVAGTGPTTVEVYTDFLCAQCRTTDAATRPVLDHLVATNRIRLVWHPIALLDEESTPTGYSSRAANALACASDAGKLRPFADALYANQPAPGGAGLSDDQIMDMAGPVGLNAPAFAACVRDQRYHDWVAIVDASAVQRGVATAPAIFVNGTRVSQLTPQAITAAVG